MREDVGWGYRVIDMLKEERKKYYIPGYQSTGGVYVYPDEKLVVVETFLKSYEKVCYDSIISGLKASAETVLRDNFPGWTHKINIR